MTASPLPPEPAPPLAVPETEPVVDPDEAAVLTEVHDYVEAFKCLTERRAKGKVIFDMTD